MRPRSLLSLAVIGTAAIVPMGLPELEERRAIAKPDLPMRIRGASRESLAYRVRKVAESFRYATENEIRGELRLLAQESLLLSRQDPLRR